MATKQAVRRWIMTGAVAAITATGALYGAGLRTRQEYTQKKKRTLEASPEDAIAQLEAVRSQLVSKKNEMERRLTDFSARRREKERAGKDIK